MKRLSKSPIRRKDSPVQERKEAKAVTPAPEALRDFVRQIARIAHHAHTRRHD